MTTQSNKAQFVALNPQDFKEIVRQYALNKAQKSEHERAARACGKIVSEYNATLLRAMEGYHAATCGRAVLTIKETEPKPGAITLKDGRRIMLEDVSYIVVGKERIAMSEVKTLYGGASGSETVEVKGEP